jgi:WD40 repeat protein
MAQCVSAQSIWVSFRKVRSSMTYLLGVCLLLNTAQPAQGSAPAIPATAGKGEEEQRRTDLYGDPLPHGALARMGTLRLWTGAPTRSITFARDSKSVAAVSMCYSGRIPVWQAISGRLLRTLPASEERLPEDFSGMRKIVFSPDGRTLAACGDETIIIFQPTTGQIVHVLRRQQGGIFELAFAADCKTLLSVGGDQTVRIWNLDAGVEIRRFPLSGQVLGSIALSPNGTIVASGCIDGTTKLWDASTGNLRRCFAGETLSCFCTFSADGRTITSLSTGGAFRTWELDGGKEVHSVRLSGWSMDPAFAVSADLNLIAGMSGDAKLGIWEAASGKLVQQIPFEPWNNIYVLTFSPDNKLIASASREEEIVRLWDVPIGKEKVAYPRHLGAVRSLAFLSDDKIVASAGDDATIRLWDVKTGKQVFSALDDTRRIWNSRIEHEDRLDLFERTGPTGVAAVSADGKTAVSAFRDGTLTFWDVAKCSSVRGIRLDCSGQIATACFAPDRKMIAATDIGNNTLGLWDLGTGKNIHRVAVNQGRTIRSLVFASDGEMIASGSDDGTVTLWETKTFRLLDRIQVSQKSVQCVAFSADGKMISAGGLDAVLRVWVLDTGEIQRSPDFAEPDAHVIRTVEFSPDGRRVAWAGDDAVVRIWDVRRGEAVAEYPGHLGRVNRLVFNGQSNRLASACDDGTTLIWDVPGNRE